MKKFLFLLCSLLMTAVGIKAEDITVTYDVATGTFYRSGSAMTSGWCSKWVSTTEPQVTFSVGVNNMNAATGGIASGSSQSAVFTIEAPAGYLVKGYSFWASEATEAGVTITPSGQDPITIEGPGVSVEVTGNDKATASFTLAGPNKEVSLSEFVITVAVDENYVPPVYVTDLADLSNNKCYIVYNKRAAWNVADGATKGNGANLDREAVSQRFAIITFEDNYYIYSVNAKAFLTKDNTLGDPDPVQIVESGVADYPWFFKFDDSHNVNVNGSKQMLIDSWTTVDDGNANAIIEAADFDPFEALAVLDPSTAEPKNLDFEESTPIDNGICTYAKDMAKNSTTYFGAQPVEGWSVLNVTDNVYEGSDRGALDQKAAGVLAYGSSAWIGGTDYKAPAAGPENSEGKNALGMISVWGGDNAIVQYTQKVILPAGNYVLTIPVMNTAGTNTLTQNLMGFIAADGTKYLAKTLQYPVGEWYNEVITFSLIEPTAGVLSLGIQNNAGSGSAPHLFIDCVKIETTTNAEVVRAELKAALAEADKVVEAKAGIGEGLFLIPEAEYDTFAAAVAAAQAVADNTEATAEELEEAKAALATAVEAYADAKVGPEADATYTFQQKSSGLYLALDAANDKVMISETAQAFTFEAGEGGYYLINEEGAVGFAGTNNWTMSANAEKKMIINPTPVDIDGVIYYTLDEVKGMIATDGETDGSACYTDKSVAKSGDKAYWTIAKVEAEHSEAYVALEAEIATAEEQLAAAEKEDGKEEFQAAIAAAKEQLGKTDEEMTAALETLKAAEETFAAAQAGTVAIEILVDKEHGTYYNAAGDPLTESGWAATWTSTQENPGLTLTATSGINVANGMHFGPAGVTYTLTASEGYHITGYALTASNTPDGSSVLTPEGGEGQAFEVNVPNEVSGLDAQTTTFVISEGRAQITKFVVYLTEAEPAPEPAVFEYTKYIVQNVGSGLYWGAGNDWGTRASLIANPEFVKFDPTDMPEGQYKLESQVNNGGTQYYFNGDYMDNGSPIALAISKLANGNFTIANAADGGFYGYDGNSTVLGKGLTNADDPNAQWTIVTLEEAKAALANATEEAPMNAGLLFDDLNFGRNNRYSNKWIVSEDCTNKNLSGGNNTNNNAESFHSVFTVSQSVEAPNGVYAITAQGFYRQDGDDNENLPVFFANEETKTFPLKTGSENSMTDASNSFTNGLYTIEPIYVQVTDGTLNIGAKLEGNTNLWCIWDNFQVKYYGADADINNVKFAALIAQVNELRAKAEELKANEYVTEIAAGVLENALTETAEVENTEEALKAAIETLKAAIETGDICVEIAPKLAAAKTLLASTNVYTAEAKAAYEAYIAEAEGKYTDGTLTRAEASAFENPLVVTGWHHDATKVADDLLLSAWTINEVQAKDFTTSLYINTWSIEGESDGSNFKVPFFEYWTGDDQSLGKATLTATMTDIEPGYYEVSVWARVRAKNGYTAPAYGITLDVNGEGAEDVAAGKQVGTTQFYLAEFKAYGNVAEDGILKINLNVAEDNNISWLSFKNVNFKATTEEDAAYDRAIAAIEDGKDYRIFTEVDGQKYYVTVAGKLSDSVDEGGIFTFKKVTGGAYKQYGWKIDSGSKRFTNPPLSNNVANLTPGAFATTNGDRNDWEAQVLFLTDGKYAIRSCNVTDGTSSWNDAGRTYWTWAVEDAVVPQYSYDKTFVWQLEGPVTTINVTYALYDADGTDAISTVTKKQDANSEVNVPEEMTSSFAYDYATEGTIGEEDCTIKVVRTFKEGVVHSLDDLSNEKAYTIRCDRGALLTKDGYVASTAHGSLNGAEAGQFAIINYEDHYYLYSIADGKFMTFDVSASPEGARGPLADEPTHGTDDAIILEAKTDPYFLAYFTVDGTNYGFNTNGNDPYGYVINTWMTADPGNLYYMVEAADFDPTEALAALEEYFHPGGVGIKGVDANLENAVIYDLTGRRVSEAMKGGIYIVNGKKVFIK